MNSVFADPTLELHIPISPTRPFFNMVHYFVHSLRAYGGRYRDARVVVTMGEDPIIPDIEERVPWLREQRVAVQWAAPALFEQHSWFGTAMARFLSDFKADVVLMLDADTLLAQPLDELVAAVYEENVVAGMVAHVPPFKNPSMWQQVYDTAGLGPAKMTCEHTGWDCKFDSPEKRHCPPYFNFGAVAMPRAFAEALGGELIPMMDCVNSVTESFFRAQIALTLAIVKLRLPYRCLAMRYNAANDPKLMSRHREELQQAHIIHMLRDHQFYKSELFVDLSRVEAFLERQDLDEFNTKIQRVLGSVHEQVSAEQARFPMRLPDNRGL